MKKAHEFFAKWLELAEDGRGYYRTTWIILTVLVPFGMFVLIIIFLDLLLKTGI